MSYASPSRTIESPFSGMAGSVTFSGASPTDWNPLRSPGRRRHAKLPSLETPTKNDLEQAAVVMRQISAPPAPRKKAKRRAPTESVYEEEVPVTPVEPRKRARHAPAKPCNCRRSRCLKLYCECFAAGVYCKHCNCGDCLNEPKISMAEIEKRSRLRQERDGPDSPRFAGRVRHCDGGTPDAPKRKHHKREGCFCKRSRCLKKYCECFEAGLVCDAKCRCSACLNFAGSLELSQARAKSKTPVDDEERKWGLVTTRAIERKQKAAEEALAAANAARDVADRATDLDDAAQVALRIATAAATEGTRASYARRQSERDELRIARAVATATYGAVLETQDEAMATDAATWGHVAARAAQQARAAGRDEAQVQAAAHQIARRHALDSRGGAEDLSRRAKELETRAQDLAKEALASRNTLAPKQLRDKFEKHAAHVRRLKARDGDMAPGLPIHRPLAVKILQCLPSEDLYGSCLVNRDWTDLALDKALWSFFQDDS
ncbi:hypothetical protein CTAYLR_008277 [Chrysophaeum taylorii]|uniref:CRC domain-containing protein n=1 Tax=Chrysophaeum taylorii TaxID=2483200 RepID=A0AAD7UCH4_9STRA|nr:hypothetical protein CTAYLR_008277 [Chrysophaeum taylorii]